MVEREDSRNLFLAIAYGKVHRLSSLISCLSNVDCRDSTQRTPLIQAVFSNRDDIRAHCVRLLVRHGCDVNAKDGDGRTALMYACMEEDKYESVRLLVNCEKCDPNLVDNEGYSAIMHAVMAGNSKAIKIVSCQSTSRIKVNIDMRNRQNLTALDLAVKLRLADCCSALVNEGRANIQTVKNNASLVRLLSEGRVQTQMVNGALLTPREDTSLNSGILLRSRLDTHITAAKEPSSPIHLCPTPLYLQRRQSDLQTQLVESLQVSPRDLTLEFLHKPTASCAAKKLATPIRRSLTPISPRDTLRQAESPIHKLLDKSKLPSIGSKRYCFLSPRDTPTILES